MTSTALMERPGPRANADMVEKVLLGGDLSTLTAEERLTYYKDLCLSLGLNPLSRPFEYHDFKGKRVLYARKDATEQLRRIHDVSIGKLDILYADDLVMVTVEAHLPSGRSDMDAGGVPIKGLVGEDRVNAVLKAVTKAKRRVTLSICGLGMLDETEIESTEAPPRTTQAKPRGGTTIHESTTEQVVSEPVEVAEYRKLDDLLSKDPEAAQALKAWLNSKELTVSDLSLGDVRKNIARLEQRATDRALAPQEPADEQVAAEAEVEDVTMPQGEPAPSPLQLLNSAVDRAAVWLETDANGRDATEARHILDAFKAALGPAFVKPPTPSAEGIGIAIQKNRGKARAQIEAASQQDVSDDETPF